MGFYSLYRIFKDIFKSIFGNKSWRITLIICLVFLVIILFNNKVNASDLRPWNVYTNTTEFNWSRLTNLGFVSSSLPYKMYEIKPDETYYLYNPNPSSVSTIHYFCYSSNDVDRPQVLIEDTSFQSALHLNYNFEMPTGYIDIPYNTLFTPQMTFYVFITDSCELFLLDDNYSNIETYNELSALANDLREYFYGQDLQPLSSSYVSGVGSSISGMSFITNNSYIVQYFPVKSGYKYKVNFSYLSSESVNADFLRFGFCPDVPSVGGSISTLHQWNYINYSSEYTFTSDFTGYAWFSYRSDRFDNFSVTSNYVDGMSGGINQQIINQGQETRETLTDSSISQDSSDYSLPTDSTNDITATGFATIFDRIKNTFTSPNSTPIVITVPFTGKTFTISKQTVYGSANLGIVQTLIECFWWYIIALFVCKDVFKKIEKLKTGNIEFTETTNIKEDIL